MIRRNMKSARHLWKKLNRNRKQCLGELDIQSLGKPRFIQNCTASQEAVNKHISLNSVNNNEFTILCTNADSLQNKLTELKAIINSNTVKPKLVAITEFKHKNKTDVQVNEFNLPG